jgi:hypothetical protein
MRLIRFHTTSNQELVFLNMGVVRRALRREQPDQHVMASLRVFRSGIRRQNGATLLHGRRKFNLPRIL